MEHHLVLREKCPVCQFQGSFGTFIRCKDHTVTGEEFNIVTCPACGLKFTNPIPAPDRIAEYYASQEYISHSDTKSGLVAKVYHLIRSRAIRQKLSLVEKHVSRGTLIDYGCGTGTFLNFAIGRDWKVAGLEPDSGARTKAAVNGAAVYATLEELMSHVPAGSINAVTMWHVLEHVYDLRPTLQALGSLLSSGGAFIIAVPNYLSHDAAHYGRHWAAYDVPRHLYHFDTDTLSKLFSTLGFGLEKCYPMPFDSFYVSLLSEKYKNGSTRYLPALSEGLRSNLRASRPENYSSVIYVFKRGA